MPAHRLILALALPLALPLPARAQADTFAIDSATRVALSTVLEKVDRRHPEGPICLVLRTPRGAELVPPSWVLYLNPRLALVRPKNCPRGYATSGGFVDPETGVRADPDPPPGYREPYVLTVIVHPYSPPALPILDVRLQHGTGFNFGACDYAQKLAAYICELNGVGFY